MPSGWACGLGKGSQGTFSADDSNVFAGKRALKIDITSAPNKSTVSSAEQYKKFRQPLSAPTKCNVSLKICGMNVSRAYIVLKCEAGSKKDAIWKNLGNLSGTFGWKDLKGEVTLTAGITSVALSIRVNTPGTLWVDEVSVDMEENQEELKPQLLSFAGEVLSTTGLPGNWQKKEYIGNENVSTIAIKREGGMSYAEQSWKVGAAHAGFTAFINDGWLKADAIQLSGSVRTVGQGKATVGMEFFDNNGKSIGEVAAPDIQSSAWKPYTLCFIAPANAARAAVILNNTGMGTVHFSDVAVASGVRQDAIQMETPAISASIYPVKHSLLQQNVKEPEFNTFTDSPTKLTFHFSGERRRMRKPTLCIDMPPDAYIAEAICPHPNSWQTEPFRKESITRPEGNYTRYHFEDTMGMKLARRTETYQRRLVMVIMPTKPGDTFQGKKVFYHLENDGTAYPEASFNLNMLPPMPSTPNPKRFFFYRWNDEDFTWGNDEVFMATIRCQEEANYKGISRYKDSVAPRMKEVREIVEKRGWHLFPRGGLNHAARHFSSVDNVEYAVKADGTKMPSDICPSFLTTAPEFAAKRDSMIRNDIAKRHPKPGEFFYLDSEEWQPMDWCFCLRCRTLFAKMNNLASVPEAAEIRKKYSEKWRDFRTVLASWQIKINSDIAKEFGLKTWDYNYVVDYSKPDFRNRYYSIAKDTLLNEQYQDGSCVSYYHVLDAEAFDMVAVARKYLTKPFAPICAVDGAGSYLSPTEVLTPARFRMMIHTASVNGCPGYSIYPGERLDAKFYIAGDKAMAEIAAVEDILLDGSFTDSIKAVAMPLKESRITAGGKSFVMEYPRWSESYRYIVRELNGRKLLCLLNFSNDNAAYVKVTLDGPLGKRRVMEYACKQSVPLPQDTTQFLVKVPQMDARFLEISESADTSLPAAQPQAEINAEYLKAAALASGNNATYPEPWKKDGFNFYYDVDGDGKPAPVIANANQTLQLGLHQGAKIINWTVDGISMCPAPERVQLLSESRIWSPQSARGDDGKKRTSSIVSSEIIDGKAVVVLKNTFVDEPIELTKTYTIPAKGASFTAQATFKNLGNAPVTLVVWQRNNLNPGNNENTLEHGDILYSLNGKEQTLNRSLTTMRLELPCIDSFPPDRRKFDSTAKTDGLSIRQLFPKHNLCVTYAPHPGKTTSFSFYNSISASTVEWQGAAVTLKTGESTSFTDNFTATKITENPVK